MEVEIKHSFKYKNKNDTLKIVINSNDTPYDLKNILYNAFENLIPKSRINLYYIDPKSNNKVYLSIMNKPILTYPNFSSTSLIYANDNGINRKQPIADIIQYIFPLIYIVVIYYKRTSIKTFTQRMFMLMTAFHFCKKIIAKLILWKKIKDELPLHKLVKYCLLFWVMFGVICGTEIFRKSFKEPNVSGIRYLFIIGYFISEYYGFLFEINGNRIDMLSNVVYCPEYLLEMVGWICMFVFCQTWTLGIFVCGISILLINKGRVIKEEKEIMNSINDNISSYNKHTKNNYNKGKKWAIIPFVI